MIIFVFGVTDSPRFNFDTKAALASWGKWLKEQSKQARSIYAYFNNDAHAHAIKNAKQLKQQLLKVANRRMPHGGRDHKLIPVAPSKRGYNLINS